MPNSIASQLMDLSIISEKNNQVRPKSSSSRRGLNNSNLNNNNNGYKKSSFQMEDDDALVVSSRSLHNNNIIRPSSSMSTSGNLKQHKEAEKENNNHINDRLNISAYKLDEGDGDRSMRVDSVASIRSYNNSPSLNNNNSKNSPAERPQSSFLHSIAKRAPMIPRPGSAPLTKKGRLESSNYRSKTPSELYDESFNEMQRRDESNIAISNPWHQTLDENHDRPLINSILHEFRDNSRSSSRMSNGGDKKDFIQMNREFVHDSSKGRGKRNSGTSRPHSYVLDNSIDGSDMLSTSSHLEGEEKRKSHSSLMKKYSTRQSVPRAVNSRTTFNPSTMSYDNSSPLKNRPMSALSKVMYKQTTRHQDVVSVMSETIRPRSSMGNYSSSSTKDSTFKRPTNEEPFKKTARSSFLNIQGFSINQSKVVHEGNHERPRSAKRGAPKPKPQPHTVALCVHNSRFSIEN